MRRWGIEYENLGNDAFMLRLPEFDVILLQLSTNTWVASFRLGNEEIKTLNFEAESTEDAFRKCDGAARVLSTKFKEGPSA